MVAVRCARAGSTFSLKNRTEKKRKLIGNVVPGTCTCAQRLHVLYSRQICTLCVSPPSKPQHSAEARSQSLPDAFIAWAMQVRLQLQAPTPCHSLVHCSRPAQPLPRKLAVICVYSVRPALSHSTASVTRPIRQQEVVRVASSPQLSSGLPVDTGAGGNLPPPPDAKQTGGDGGSESNEDVDGALGKVIPVAGMRIRVMRGSTFCGILAVHTSCMFRLAAAENSSSVEFTS